MLNEGIIKRKLINIVFNIKFNGTNYSGGPHEFCTVFL